MTLDSFDLAILRRCANSPATLRYLVQACDWICGSSVLRHAGELVRAGLLVRHDRGDVGDVWAITDAGRSKVEEPGPSAVGR